MVMVTVGHEQRLETQLPATTGSPDSQPSRTNSTLGTWHQQDCSRPLSTVWVAHPATSTRTYSPTQIVPKVSLMRPWKTGSTYVNLKPGKEAVGADRERGHQKGWHRHEGRQGVGTACSEMCDGYRELRAAHSGLAHLQDLSGHSLKAGICF